MRLLKLSAVMVCLLFGAVLMLSLVSLRAAPRGGQIPARNGDVNCDGTVDISDPVHLLSWLFTGGPEPCAAQEPDPCCPAQVDQIKAISTELAAQTAKAGESVEELRSLAEAVKAQGVKSDELLDQVKRIASALERTAPPKQRDMVSLSPSITVPPGETITVFEVPKEKAFILTDIRSGSVQSEIEIVEILGETITAKTLLYYAYANAAIPTTFSPRTGFAFSPGSLVAVRSRSSGSTAVVFLMIGYLADP